MVRTLAELTSSEETNQLETRSLIGDDEEKQDIRDLSVLVNQDNKYNLNVDYNDDFRKSLYQEDSGGLLNAVNYGWNQGQSGIWHLAANVPGLIDAVTPDVLGIDVVMGKAENYLRNRSHATSPETLGIEAPDTLAEKIAAGFAHAPWMIAEYLPATKALKLLGAGRRALPLAFAFTDGMRASDEGVMATAVAGAKGYVLGSIIQASNVLNLPTRMGAMFGLGFFTSGGEIEDRVAGGVVFGTLSAIGPVKGKSIKDLKKALMDDGSPHRIKMAGKGAVVKMYHDKITELNKHISEKEKEITLYNQRKKPKKEIQEENQKKLSQLLENKYQAEKAKEAFEKSLFIDEKIAPEMIGLDTRPAMEVYGDLFNIKGEAKYIEPKSMSQKTAVMAFPTKYLTKYPLLKWVADKSGLSRISSENKIDELLFDYRTTPVKLGQVKIDWSRIAAGEMGGFKVGGFSALKNLERTQTDGAGLTRAMKMIRKDWKQLDHVIKQWGKIDVDTKFKKEITDTELKNTYKFNKEQILVYRDMRGGLTKAHEFYNEYIKNFVEPIPEMWARRNAPKKIPYRVNYMPHMFLGKFRVWVNKKSDTELKNPILALPEGNKISAEFTARKLRKELGDDYRVAVQVSKRSGVSNRGIDAFQEALLYAEKIGKSDVAKTIHEIQNKILSTRGFAKHTVKRKNVPGYAGTKEGFSGVRDFVEGYKVYVRGAIEKAHSFKLTKETNDLLNEGLVKSKYSVTRDIAVKYRENALGRLPNVITNKTRDMTRNWIGDSGAEGALGWGNRVTLNLRLLFGQVRFLLSQGIQPFQMIPAKLINLESKGYKGNMWEAIIEAQKDLISPDKQIRELHDYAFSQRTIEPKFLQEAAEGFTGKAYAVGQSKYTVNPSKILDAVVFKGIAGKMEGWSRLNAVTMFYRFLRKAGFSHKRSMVDASALGDKYMVEYNSYERPGMYNERGLGTLGRPFGLFKTFQHNYFAQLTEHIQQITQNLKPTDVKSWHHAKGLTAFTGTMILSAGLYSVIGIEVADKLINTISPVWQKMFGKKPQTLTELVMHSDLPDWVKWGTPSASFEADLTATLAAPGLGFGDLVSVPTLELLGLHPAQLGAPGFRNRKGGVLQTSFSFLYKGIMGTATADDAQKFYSSVAPTSLQGVIEQWYSGYDVLIFDSPHPQLGVVRDPWKKGRGEVRRDLSDWYARYISSYSLDEAVTLKTIYQLSVINRNAQANQESLTATAAHLVVNGHAVPRWIFDESLKNGVDPKALNTKIQNRIKLMSTTLVSREINKKSAMINADTYDLLQPVFSKESQKVTPIIFSTLKNETIKSKDTTGMRSLSEL